MIFKRLAVYYKDHGWSIGKHQDGKIIEFIRVNDDVEVLQSHLITLVNPKFPEMELKIYKDEKLVTTRIFGSWSDIITEHLYL